VSGYRADLDAIGAAGRVLRDTVDTVSAALGHLDGGVCATVGPGRLGAALAGLTEDARSDLRRVLGSVTEDAERVRAAVREYAEHDQAAADELVRRTDD